MPDETAVERFMAEVPDAHRPLVDAINATIMELHPAAVPAIKWNNLVYRIKTEDQLYIAHFEHHVNLGFMDGAELPDPDGRLEGTGERMRHVKLTGADEVRSDGLRSLIEAVG